MDKKKDQKPLESILKTAQAIGQGDYSHEAPVTGEGAMATLASEMNLLLKNLGAIKSCLNNSTEQIPDIVNSGQNISQLINDATEEVLNLSDEILSFCDHQEQALNQASGDHSEVQEFIREVRARTFDIISAQSFQDTVSQRMDKLVGDIENIRDELIQSISTMQLDDEQETEKDKTTRKTALGQVSKPADSRQLKQDLVDELLSEFGL